MRISILCRHMLHRRSIAMLGCAGLADAAWRAQGDLIDSKETTP